MRHLFAAIFAVLVSSAAAVPAAAAPAGRLEPVLVLKHGKVSVHRERFLGPTSLPGLTPQRVLASAAAAKKKAPRGRATRLAIDDLLAQGLIDQPTRDARQVSL